MNALSASVTPSDATVGVRMTPHSDDARPAASERVRRWAAVIDRYVFAGGPHGCEDAAIRLEADDEIRDALAALQLVERLSVMHQERRWSDDSESATCTCGRGWPCDVRAAIDQED